MAIMPASDLVLLIFTLFYIPRRRYFEDQAISAKRHGRAAIVMISAVRAGAADEAMQRAARLLLGEMTHWLKTSAGRKCAQAKLTTISLSELMRGSLPYHYYFGEAYTGDAAGGGELLGRPDVPSKQISHEMLKLLRRKKEKLTSTFNILTKT